MTENNKAAPHFSVCKCASDAASHTGGENFQQQEGTAQKSNKRVDYTTAVLACLKIPQPALVRRVRELQRGKQVHDIRASANLSPENKIQAKMLQRVR